MIMDHESASSNGYDSGTALFITGFISSSVQLLLLREMMNITGGYELISGSFLSAWLIGSALGSSFARGTDSSGPGRILMFFTVAPLISLFLLLLLTRLILHPGETPSFFSGLIVTFLSLLPFCFVSGYTFIKLTVINKASGRNPGRSFSVETSGGILAGIAISMAGAMVLNTYQALIIITLMGITYCLLTFRIRSFAGRLVIKFVVLAAVSLMLLFPPDIFFRQIMLKGIKVTGTFDTPYGNVTRGEYHGEESLWYNQRLVKYSEDAVESEEDIHYCMLQTENPAAVLLVSGGTLPRLREIDKHNVDEVVYVELDPALSAAVRDMPADVNPPVVVINDDALGFVRRTGRKFDAVIMLLPPPSTLSLNRYYTLEFFRSVKKRMNHGAVFSCSPGIIPGYLNDGAVKFSSSVYNSLKKVFANVVPVAGSKLYFIASDNKLSTSFCMLVEKKELKNSYVCSDYLSDDLVTARSEELTRLMDRSAKLNRLMTPEASFHYQSFILSRDTSAKIPSLLLAMALFALSLLSFKKRTGMMYFSALALAGYEIILLLILQLAIGNMYQATGMVIAGLMGGLALGSGSGNPVNTRRNMTAKTLLLIFLYALTGLLAGRLADISCKPAVTGLLIAAGFLPAYITGSFYRDISSGGPAGPEPSVVYSSDLSGSALGFILFSGFTVPLLGIKVSLFILPVLISAGFLFIPRTEE